MDKQLLFVGLGFQVVNIIGIIIYGLSFYPPELITLILVGIIYALFNITSFVLIIIGLLKNK